MNLSRQNRDYRVKPVVVSLIAWFALFATPVVCLPFVGEDPLNSNQLVGVQVPHPGEFAVNSTQNQSLTKNNSVRRPVLSLLASRSELFLTETGTATRISERQHLVTASLPIPNYRAPPVPIV